MNSFSEEQYLCKEFELRLIKDIAQIMHSYMCEMEEKGLGIDVSSGVVVNVLINHLIGCLIATEGSCEDFDALSIINEFIPARFAKVKEAINERSH